jgi:hypothetical protein
MYKFSNKELEDKIEEIREELEKREKEEITIKWHSRECESEIIFSFENDDKIFIRPAGLLIENDASRNEAKINPKEFFLIERQIGLGYYDDQSYYIVYDKSENLFNLIKESPTFFGDKEYNYYYLTESDIINFINLINNITFS